MRLQVAVAGSLGWALGAPVFRKALTASVTNETGLNDYIGLNADTIYIVSNITITAQIMIETGFPFTINGDSNTIDAAGSSSRCLYVKGSTTDVTITNLFFTNGSPAYTGGLNSGAGGALVVRDGALLTLMSCVISGNTAVEMGGGILVWYGTLVLVDTVVRENEVSSPSGSVSSSGGGIMAMGYNSASLSVIELIGSKVMGNVAASEDGHGGGMYLGDNSFVSTNEAEIADNLAAIGAGVKIAGGNTKLNLARSWVHSNYATGGAGALQIGPGTPSGAPEVNIIGSKLNCNGAAWNETADVAIDTEYPGTVFEVFSACNDFPASSSVADRAYAGGGTTIACNGCPEEVPADLYLTQAEESGLCAVCSFQPGSVFACCGALACEATTRTCSPTEQDICSIPNSTAPYTGTFATLTPFDFTADVTCPSASPSSNGDGGTGAAAAGSTLAAILGGAAVFFLCGALIAWQVFTNIHKPNSTIPTAEAISIAVEAELPQVIAVAEKVPAEEPSIEAGTKKIIDPGMGTPI